MTAFVHLFVCSCVRVFVCSCVRVFVRSCVCVFVCSFVRWCALPNFSRRVRAVFMEIGTVISDNTRSTTR